MACSLKWILCLFSQSSFSLHQLCYAPEVDDQAGSVDHFVPDVLNNNLGDGLDLLEVSEHVKTQVADVVFKYVGVERDFDQLDVHLGRIILLEKKNRNKLQLNNIFHYIFNRKKIYFQQFVT